MQGLQVSWPPFQGAHELLLLRPSVTESFASAAMAATGAFLMQ
jgi:hypothetical protein